MIRKLVYLFVIFIVLLQCNANGQGTGLYFNTLNQNSNRLQGKLQGEIYYLNVVRNSNYFLQTDWEEGTITLNDGDFFEGLKMRYMTFGDELVVYNDNNLALFIVDKSTVKQFTFKTPSGLDDFKERKFINLDSLVLIQNKTFFEELYSGSVKLLAFHQVEVTKVKPFTDANGRLRDTEYNLETKYYFLSGNFSLERIKLRTHYLTKLFPENKKEVRAQLRKFRIRVTDERSAIQAFKLLDESGVLE